MKTHAFLAFDIGATSGRAVVLTIASGKFETKEINRFANSILEIHGKYYWDIYSIYKALKESLAICAKQNINIQSIGIDTWGVDFGYIAKDGTLLGLPRAYRDPYTNGAPEEFFKLISHKEVYRLTGIQMMNFNSLFQLFRAKQESFGQLEAADKILFIPDLLSYLLTKKMVCEYTDASTSQFLNPVTKQFEPSLLAAAGVSQDILCPLVMPGTIVGDLSPELISETGIGKIPVVAVAGHDTASAVVAVPALDKEFAFVSSGTWSLMGIETEEPIITEKSLHHNFTNEGGIEGTTRFLKNITGMWLLEQCRKEWEKEGRIYTYDEIIKMVEQAEPFRCFVNPDYYQFANPVSMTAAISEYCKNTNQPAPQKDAEYIRCIFESLSLRYKEVLNILEEMAPFPIRKLHVIGGGSMNKLLNQFVANVIGMPVIAGPSEATAIGNCMIQAKTSGIVKNRWEIRQLVKASVSPITYMPKEREEWENAYAKYKKVTLVK